MTNKRWYLLYFLVPLVFLLGFYSNKLFNNRSEKNIDGLKYDLLASRIQIDNPNDIIIQFSDLRKELIDAVEPWGDTFSFYFEYLPTGISIGVNENTKYTPQSLIKVPIVMALYHYRERLGYTEDKEVEIQKSQIDNRFGELWKKGEGYKISLDEAARLAITESDNTASEVLAGNIPFVDYEKVYSNLDIEYQGNGSVIEFSAKDYSSILKSLYFSSLLTKEHSQIILELLSKAKFGDGLRNQIPEDVPIAHKAGILSDAMYQDCGVVYVPKRQYLLCMVSSSSESESIARMNKVSDIVYNFISSK